MNLIAALDIGGTKLAAGLVDADATVHARTRVPTRATGRSEDLFADVVGLVASVLDAAPAGAQVVALGVGCGGPMQTGPHQSAGARPGPDAATTVSPLNIPAWREFPLHARLDAEFGARLGGIPAGPGVPASAATAERARRVAVAVDNDAKALALAEGWVGAARGVADYLGMVVSTGVGGGIVLDGRLLHGAGTNAGHIGHICVVPDGNLCGCGARGCVEAEASGTAVARKAAARWRADELGSGRLSAAFRAAAASNDAGTARSLTTVDGIAAPDVLAAANAGDPAAHALLAEAGVALGRAIGSVAALLDLGLAVVGGGLALAAGEALWDPMRRTAADVAQISFARGLRIVPAACGDDAGLIGAAAVAYVHATGRVPAAEPPHTLVEAPGGGQPGRGGAA